MKLLPTKLIVLSSLFSGFAIAEVPEYNAFYVFGDSLSDNGNLYTLQPDKVYAERLTNGMVAVEYAAEHLNVLLAPSLHLSLHFSGTNYAVAGARSLDNQDASFEENAINLPTQVNAFLSFNSIDGTTFPNKQLDSDALYFVGIGGNDIRDARDAIQASIPEPTPLLSRVIAYSQVNSAAEATLLEISKLATFGAKDIIVMNAPDIGAIPESDLLSQQILAQVVKFSDKLEAIYLPYTATNLSVSYNATLHLGLKKLRQQFPEANIQELDLFKLEKTITSNPELYSLTDTDRACNYVFSTGNLNDFSCGGYLYFDEIHPTTAVHRIIGKGIINTIESGY
ncbi:hypothetical protein BCV08_10330 [Vibrio breoganii]|uniref:SGNH/GDSL hydrolase family protein n=1 Tax=Vibrio breoganii TaxID=553239 RepID=UPI000C82204F|nr:SGNH/GDSL hydrolase family protein [Vibrio breoganii]PMF96633.1 hypothetical protein BCV08_10330 [Vibrio breoganii]